jgi:hypothetical protein
VLQDLQTRLVMPIEQLVRNAPRRPLVSQFQSFRAKPLYADDRYDLFLQNSADGGSWLEVFEARHILDGGGFCRTRWNSYQTKVKVLARIAKVDQSQV